jgi:hypothetical protein
MRVIGGVRIRGRQISGWVYLVGRDGFTVCTQGVRRA